MKETSILTLWQNWNHINNLIEMRAATFKNVQRLSERQIKENLKIEFGSDYPAHWRDMIVKPLVDQVCKLGGYDSVEVSGPFGIGARVRASFFKNETKESVADISFEPNLSVDSINKENAILSKIDYSSSSNQFKVGTVGEINGFNFGRIELDNDFTASQILPLLDIVSSVDDKKD